jgi:RNA polymerase sigma-70 factor (ECF subfamily)
VLSATYDSQRFTPSFDEDIILVERFLGNDQEAFQTLYERYHDKVLAIARGILLDAEEAHDAVQEIFTLVFRNLHRFDRRSKFSTWLFRIAVNRSIQQARTGKIRKLQVPLAEAFEHPAPEESESSADPFIAEAMAKLHPADRALLTLFYWDELSLQEIADSLDCSANAAKTRLFRARERFRQQYEEVSE